MEASLLKHTEQIGSVHNIYACQESNWVPYKLWVCLISKFILVCARTL